MSQWLIDIFKTGLHQCAGCQVQKPMAEFDMTHFCTTQCSSDYWDALDKELDARKQDKLKELTNIVNSSEE